MLHEDYLMRMFLQFAEIIRKSWMKEHDEHDPKAAAESLENAVSVATDMDGETLLSLAPESIAGVMQVSGIDSHATEYVARSLLLASAYLREAGDNDLADIREQQARAIADAYGFSLPEQPDGPEALLEELEAEGERFSR